MKEEQKEKLRKIHSTPEKIEFFRKLNLGRTQSLESRKKIAFSKQGTIQSNETRKKISLGNKGKSQTETTKQLIGLANRGKLKGRKTGNQLHRHHKDLDRTNNHPDNILLLTNSKHSSLHRQAYRYLVSTGQTDQYIDWFMRRQLNENVLSK